MGVLRNGIFMKSFLLFTKNLGENILVNIAARAINGM
jgi:hypothetical protein